LSRLVGYTIAASKTVVGYIEDDKKRDDFEGCNFNRTPVFEDNTGVRCSSYSYSYSYRPTAYILVKGSNIKLCIENELYDVMPLR
jgi:hypothetical protein